jgi:hypothetical protein
MHKQTLRFTQDDNRIRHSRAGGNPAKQKRFSQSAFEVKRFVFKALDSRMRGNDGDVLGNDGEKNVGWAKRSVPTLSGRWAHCVLPTLLWLKIRRYLMVFAFIFMQFAALHATAASKAEPPLCGDLDVLEDIMSSYQQIAPELNFKKLEKIEPIELSLVDYVPSLDTKRNREMLGDYPWGKSRFCYADLKLNGGETDKVHYRIDSFKAGEQYSFNPCFESMVKHFSLSVKTACTPFSP